MAIVQGIRERVHLPIYDCVRVEPEKQLRDVETSSTLKFFVNVQDKTKLETNLQSASLLPHYNTFEARAMRVVISDLRPEFPDEDDVFEDDGFDVTDADGNPIVLRGNAVVVANPAVAGDIALAASVSLTVNATVGLIREAHDDDNGLATLDPDDDAVELSLANDQNPPAGVDLVAGALAAGGEVDLAEDDLRGMLQDQKKAPPDVQIATDEAGALINKLIYNTVTTLYVGEKVMIQMPTWFFPGGAGTYSDQGKTSAHGMPSPTDTFRFAEPIFLERQQNFRVEIEIPDHEIQQEIQRLYGPVKIWVVLDGYMNRGVM
jgi:hypothetical protein